MTKRTPQLESAILAGFAEGQTLNAMCRKFGISLNTFLYWKLGDPELAWRYAGAQLLHAESIVDECLEIADGYGENGNEPAGAAMRCARLRIDTRLKIARMHFKRHQEAVERRARQEELREAESATEPDTASPEPAERKRTRPAPLRIEAKEPGNPLRLATAPQQPEPERRYA